MNLRQNNPALMLEAAFLGTYWVTTDCRGEFGVQNCQLVEGFACKGGHGSSCRGSASRVKRLLRFFRNSGNNGVTENLE